MILQFLATELDINISISEFCHRSIDILHCLFTGAVI